VLHLASAARSHETFTLSRLEKYGRGVRGLRGKGWELRRAVVIDLATR
jgi:hypothetical protein